MSLVVPIEVPLKTTLAKGMASFVKGSEMWPVILVSCPWQKLEKRKKRIENSKAEKKILISGLRNIQFSF
jgi:hypothetical protein